MPVLLCIGILYLSVPLRIFAVDLGNLVFLCIFVIAAIFYQIGVYRGSCGDGVFYIGLPLDRRLLVAAGMGVLIVPFTVLLSAFAGAQAISGFWAARGP
jgi:hypothetical protein